MKNVIIILFLSFSITCFSQVSGLLLISNHLYKNIIGKDVSGMHSTLNTRRINAKKSMSLNKYLINSNKKSVASSRKNTKNVERRLSSNIGVIFTAIADENEFFSSRNNLYTTSNTNSCLLKYISNNTGKFKYGVHLEGQIKEVKNENGISHTYISLNSAVDKEMFTMVPANSDGTFSVDIFDDSINSITIIKKGYPVKNIPINKTVVVKAGAAYTFDLRLDGANKENNNNEKRIYERPTLSNNSSDNLATAVFFDFNKSDLKNSSTIVLNNFIKDLSQKSKTNPSITIELNGYADKMGTKSINDEISVARAVACKTYLINHGLKNVNIVTKGLGYVGDNDKSNKLKSRKERKVEMIIH